jgi:hypothetical protein
MRVTNLRPAVSLFPALLLLLGSVARPSDAEAGLRRPAQQSGAGQDRSGQPAQPQAGRWSRVRRLLTRGRRPTTAALRTTRRALVLMSSTTTTRTTPTSSRPPQPPAPDVRPVPPAEAEHTMEVRESQAIRAVESRLQNRGGSPWEISTPLVQFAGDRHNPVTGSGPIEVFARQKVTRRGGWNRLRHALSPSTARRFFVIVDPSGRPTILSSQANSLPYRAARLFNEAIPLRELVADIFRSSGVRKGVRTAGLGHGVGIGTAAAVGSVGWVVAGAFLYRAAQQMGEGVARRRIARREAMDATVNEIHKVIRNGGSVSFARAYGIYKLQLETQKPGTRAIDERDFAEQLSFRGL